MSEEIQLKHPIQLADKTLETVTMRRPTLGDMLDFPITGEDKITDLNTEAKLISKLCKLKLEEIRLLDFTDYERLQLTFIRFREGEKLQEDLA